jgi:hypothetical protein
MRECSTQLNSVFRQCRGGKLSACICDGNRIDESPPGPAAAALAEAGIATVRDDAGLGRDTGGATGFSPDDTCVTHLAEMRTSDLDFNSTYTAKLKGSQFRNDSAVVCGVVAEGPDGVDSYNITEPGAFHIKVTAYVGLGMPVLAIRRGNGECASLREISCGISPATDPFEFSVRVNKGDRIFVFWDTTGSTFSQFHYDVSLTR